jgi:hypothetical protein
MPNFSKRSYDNLITCDKRLQEIAKEAIKEIDFTIIEGHRSKEKQAENVRKGVSQTMNSKHCEIPSRAFDFIPYPFTGWNDVEAFERVAKVLLRIAKEKGILARRGSDWNMNNLKDDKFYDGPHFELLTQFESEKILKNNKKQ